MQHHGTLAQAHPNNAMHYSSYTSLHMYLYILTCTATTAYAQNLLYLGTKSRVHPKNWPGEVQDYAIASTPPG